MVVLQEKIIEELKAYKQSVITEAVTKGLNPDVLMKDSGIEWIGEIPEHWNVTKLKRIVKVSDGTHDTPEYIDKDRNSYPLVTSRCIVDGEIDISLAHHISEQDYIEISKRSAVSKYDVIMPMIGTVGNPAILMTDDKIAIKNVALFRTYGDLDKAKYIKYYLNSLLVKEQFNFTFRGGVQNFVSQDIIKNLLFLMPEDYREVVNLLDTKCTEIDNLISIKLSKIDSLKEYKKSIIYEYVTGKKEVTE
jgi:type I restriction enzyme S subunit